MAASSHAVVYSSSSSSSLDSIDVLKQLITHIPDIIVHRPPDSVIPETVRSYGVMMFADISGFTALCENYCSTSESKKKGTDQLTKTLNSYLSQIVQGLFKHDTSIIMPIKLNLSGSIYLAILEEGGDVLKFAGDALLAFWPCTQSEASEKLHFVLKGSLTMQKNFDNYQTPDGVTLRMKISLSVGIVDIQYIGNSDYKTFGITGTAVDDVNVAQSFTKPGNVVISKNAWKMCDQDRCFATFVGEDCAQIDRVSSTVQIEKSSTLNDVISHGYSSINESDQQTASRHSNISSTNIDASAHKQSIDSANDGDQSKAHELSLRPKAKQALFKFENSHLPFIKSFISKTVSQKVDHGYNMNWLSELRQVSVLFINLDPDLSVEVDEGQHLLQTAFEAVYPSLSKFDGCLNKVFMFDKGCTFLCIFGLPHASHEDDPKRAIRSAINIFNHLSNLKLKHYSIGVTTGMAFCGVVGHTQRHEYTVIGQKVNMAARLMMKFPDTVTCDETTFNKSNISQKQFTLTPPVKLKGLSKAENIYFVSTENTEDMHVSNSDIHETTDVETLIGRNKEMSVLLNELEHLMDQSHKGPGIVIITGSGGIGKTKLLRAMKAKAAEMNFRVVSGTGGLIEQNTPFYTVKTLLTRLLGLDTCSNMHDKEQLLLEHVVDEDLRKLLPILNDLLVLKFPHTEETLHMCHKERTKYLHQMLYGIVHREALTHPCLFGVDDAQWIDHDSWKFLLDLALDPHAILLLATRPLKDVQDSEVMEEIWNHPNTIVLELDGLACDEMIKLACQILNLDDLPEQIVEIIRNRSHGVPLWCEELLETMIEMKVLTIVEEDEVIFEEDEEGGEDDMKEDERCRSPSVVDNYSARKAVLKTVKKRRSFVTEKFGVKDIPIPDSVAGMVLTRIDNMNPSEQMALKCAAVLGTTFQSDMLEAIIPNCNPATFLQTLNAMAEHGIIECAIAAELRTRLPDIHTRSFHDTLAHPPKDPHLQCPCLAIQHHYHHFSSHGTSHPPVADCRHLQFIHTYIQETAYELWTENQCQSLHESAALFLESQAHKCANCGGGGFYVGPKYSKRSKKRSNSYTGRAFMGVSAIRHKLRLLSIDRRQSTNRVSTDYSVSSMPGPASQETVSSEQLIIAGGQIWLGSICSNDTGIDMRDCRCDEVLYYVYPQLVRHWRAAGSIERTLKYLMESAGAALATFNNMEAISLLQETKQMTRNGNHGDNILSIMELAKLESLFGQAYFQCGEVDECMPYFHTALRLLNTRLPRTNIGVVYNLVFQAAKQILHVNFPRCFIGRKRGQASENFLEQSRCMAHVTHAYHLQHKNIKTLMSALQQLNAAEEAQENIHELVESYTTMIECCQLFDFIHYGQMYLEKAVKFCSSVQFGLDDESTYAHLLNVALNFKLCHGMIKDALIIGSTVTRITSKVHDVPMKLAALPLLFEANLQALKIEECKENLKQLSEVSEESEDLRAEALMDCCRFDALLEIGLTIDTGHDLAKAAELCCQEDVYHFDDIERFFLISSLALWHSRRDNITAATSYIKIAQTLIPQKYDNFFAVKSFVKYLECQILLYKVDKNNHKIKKIIQKSLKKLNKLVKKFKFFSPRFLHLKAYFKYLQNNERSAKHFLKEAKVEALKVSSDLESTWIAKSFSMWFEHRKLIQDQSGVTLFSLQ